MSFFKDQLLPRSVFVPYWIAKILLTPVYLFQKIFGAKHPTKLCLEAGVRGWDLIEFKELYVSACEYIGTERVHKLAVQENEGYIPQVKKALDEFHPTHYVYDPRTGSQHWLEGTWQAFQVVLLLTRRGIVPISLLTDLPIRNWRRQSAMVTALRGIVISLQSPKKVHPIFPHRRLIGPSLMPFSEGTLEVLNNLKPEKEGEIGKVATFTGSLYEPRTTILNQIKERLEPRGITLQLKGRVLGTPRASDKEYWSRLKFAKVVVTTSDQIKAKGSDWNHLPHFIYRYLEATACGTLLVAPEIPGIERFFTPNEHYASFRSVDEAVERIEYYLNNEDARKKMAEKGRERATALIKARAYWSGIDIALGKDSLT